jgi:hypothetical protein
MFIKDLSSTYISADKFDILSSIEENICGFIYLDEQEYDKIIKEDDANYFKIYYLVWDLRVDSNIDIKLKIKNILESGRDNDEYQNNDIHIMDSSSSSISNISRVLLSIDIILSYDSNWNDNKEIITNSMNWIHSKYISKNEIGYAVFGISNNIKSMTALEILSDYLKLLNYNNIDKYKKYVICESRKSLMGLSCIISNNLNITFNSKYDAKSIEDSILTNEIPSTYMLCTSHNPEYYHSWIISSLSNQALINNKKKINRNKNKKNSFISNLSKSEYKILIIILFISSLLLCFPLISHRLLHLFKN